MANASARLMPIFGIAMWVLMTSGCMNESKVDMSPGSASASASIAQPKGMPNAEMQEVLYQFHRLHGKPLQELTAREARDQPTAADAVRALLESRGESLAPEAVARVENRTIPSADPSVRIPIRIYSPQGEGPFPIVVYYHGGGFVIADLDTYDSSARALTNAAHAIVVSAHYRQGPENRFPTAHDDAYAAYRWTLANAKSFNGDARRIALAGESAGGNLAASVAIRARDLRLQQMPVYQVLIYPVTNYALNSPSQQQNLDTRPLNTPMLRWFYDKYLTGPADGEKPLFSIRRADLTGLPPATVITADIDPLRSDGQAYAHSLQAAGVPVDYKNYEGVTHEFFGMGAVLLEARQAVDQAATALRAAFNNRQNYNLAKESSL